MSKPDEALSFFPVFTDNVSPMKHFNSCLEVKLGLCKKIYPVHQRQSWKISMVLSFWKTNWRNQYALSRFYVRSL